MWSSLLWPWEKGLGCLLCGLQQLGPMGPRRLSLGTGGSPRRLLSRKVSAPRRTEREETLLPPAPHRRAPLLRPGDTQLPTRPQFPHRLRPLPKPVRKGSKTPSLQRGMSSQDSFCQRRCHSGLANTLGMICSRPPRPPSRALPEPRCGPVLQLGGRGCSRGDQPVGGPESGVCLPPACLGHTHAIRTACEAPGVGLQSPGAGIRG